MLNTHAMALWSWTVPVGFAMVLVGGGCDDAPARKNAFDPGPDATQPAPPASALPKPQGPPELVIDDLSPRVGFSRVLLRQPSDQEKLDREVAEHADYFRDKGVPLSVARNAEPAWVQAMLRSLGEIGVSKVEIATETRKEFPQKVEFAPLGKEGAAPSCSLVMAVTADRGTAVWRLSGGVAAKRGKGMAGPDLTMTGDTILRLAKKCQQSKTFYLNPTAGIEWGLLYDLAASAYRLEDVEFERTVLLSGEAVAGRPVSL